MFQKYVQCFFFLIIFFPPSLIRSSEFDEIILFYAVYTTKYYAHNDIDIVQSLYLHIMCIRLIILPAENTKFEINVFCYWFQLV